MEAILVNTPFGNIQWTHSREMLSKDPDALKSLRSADGTMANGIVLGARSFILHCP